MTCGRGYRYRIRECKEIMGTSDCEMSERKECFFKPCLPSNSKIFQMSATNFTIVFL